MKAITLFLFFALISITAQQEILKNSDEWIDLTYTFILPKIKKLPIKLI